MHQPGQICRVCQQHISCLGVVEVCSKECAERLSEAEFYERELVEAFVDLHEFEAGVYLPLYLELARAEARLRVLQIGVWQLSRNGHMSVLPSDSLEVQEWKKAQSKYDRRAVSLVKRPLRRLLRKVHRLEEELREIDQQWQSLSARRDTALEKLSRLRGE